MVATRRSRIGGHTARTAATSIELFGLTPKRRRVRSVSPVPYWIPRCLGCDSGRIRYAAMKEYLAFALLHLATPSEKCSVGDSATTLQYAQSAACHLMAVDAILGMSRNLARASFEGGRVGEGLECLHVAALSVDDARAWFDLAEVSRIECRGYCMAASALKAMMCRHVGSTAASTRRTTHTSLPQIEIRSGHSFTSMTVRRNSLGPATVDMRGSVGTAVSSANTVKELGRQQLAITLYKKALELNPPFTTAVRTRPVFCEARAKLMKIHACRVVSS